MNIAFEIELLPCLSANGAVGSSGRRWVEDSLLKIGRQRRIKRNAFQLSNLRTQIVDFAFDSLASLFDFLLTGEEEKDVTCQRERDVTMKRLLTNVGRARELNHPVKT